MRLNSLSPAEGSRRSRVRVGRGIGSGLGKTCGRGHKGQKSRSGGFHKSGFEGGQMPIARRLPKFGFVSRKSLRHAEVRLSELSVFAEGEAVTLQSLREKGVITNGVKTAKIVKSGELSAKVAVKGLRVTKGAREAIVSAGGSVEE